MNLEIDDSPRILDSGIKSLWRISALISGAVMLALFGIFEFILRGGDFPKSLPWVGPILAIVISVYSLLMVEKNFSAWSYQLREHDLVLSHGVFWKVKRCVARDRVQHIDVRSGPIGRKFGIVEIDIHAAGLMGAVGSIPGIRPEEAERLRAALLTNVAEDA